MTPDGKLIGQPRSHKVLQPDSIPFISMQSVGVLNPPHESIHVKKKTASANGRQSLSRVTRIRTGDLYVPNVARYQLRYYPDAKNQILTLLKKKAILPNGLGTGATGLEPVISGVTGQRDNQLR